MDRAIERTRLSLSVYLLVGILVLGCKPDDLGLFSGSTDIGNVGISGTAAYDEASDTYLVSGGGANMWADVDAAQFVWTKVSGDFSIAADVQWTTDGGDPHRKAGVMIRQSLEPGAAYADVVVHGNGLTSLQYRAAEGRNTHEIQSAIPSPDRIQLERRGDYVYMASASDGAPLANAGGSFRLELTGPLFVGLVVCAHNNEVIEEARFTNVELNMTTPESRTEPSLESTLEAINVASTDRRVVLHTTDHIEAPNWSRDGSYLLYNSGGRLYTVAIAGGTPRLLDTGTAMRNNNDHGISPDGTMLAISDQSHPDGQSRVHVLPIDGGTPRLVTPEGPSYWHGWSPDGKTLAYVGLRNEEYDIYTVPVTGGREQRLTSAPGLDDGPDYSPDGRYIYFNSVRTGTMQIWRMDADGSNQTQITFDDYNDWFPHPSPDGKWIVFLSYLPEVEGHPANQDVMLRLMATDGGDIRVLTTLFGGQGTINVPSWSPDSENVAFVSYRLDGGSAG